MRLVMDACILYPTVLREILVATAQSGGFVPLYSDRLLEEWARAAARNAPETAAIARAEGALFRATFPQGRVQPDASLEATLSLPDPNDTHVLATAITGQAEAILTVNLRDFPTRTLARHGLLVCTPDSLLLELHLSTDTDVASIAEAIRARTEAISARPQPLRPLLKRAGLPRLAKALSQAEPL